MQKDHLPPLPIQFSNVLAKKMFVTIQACLLTETTGVPAIRCRCLNKVYPSTIRTKIPAQNRRYTRTANQDDCSVSGVALSASPSIRRLRK